MSATGNLRYNSHAMNATTNLAVEFRHNDEPLGRVYDSGAVELVDGVPHGDVRFWVGRQAWRAQVRNTVLVPGNVLAFKRIVSASVSSKPTG